MTSSGTGPRRLSLGQTVHLSPESEHSLRLAFQRLASYHRTSLLSRKIAAKRHQLTGQQPSARDLSRLQMEVAALQAQLESVRTSAVLITAKDLEALLRDLGCPRSKKDIEYMIWEVDENLDGCVDWEELQLTYYRNLNDTTGLEPFTLCNIVQFLMYDAGGKGYITEDDAMDSLFARYGKDRLERELTKLFGAKRGHNPVQGTLTLSEYLAIVSQRELPRPATAASSVFSPRTARLR